MQMNYSQEEVDQLMIVRIYCNHADFTIFVMRKGLYAWTMNLGNKWSWIITVTAAMIIIVIVFMMLELS